MIFSSPQLPSPTTGFVQLTGQQWLVRIWWDERAYDNTGCYRVDLLFPNGATTRTQDTDGNSLPRGVLVRVTGLDGDLWEAYRYLPAFPPGRLRAYRPDGGDAPPTYYEIGTSFILEYVEPSEET